MLVSLWGDAHGTVVLRGKLFKLTYLYFTWVVSLVLPLIYIFAANIVLLNPPNVFDVLRFEDAASEQK